MSEYRGGLHGEGHKNSSHDKGTKKNHKVESIVEEIEDDQDSNEVQDAWSKGNLDQAVEERQSQQSTQIVDKVNSEEKERPVMEDAPLNAKSSVAKIIGAYFNDARVTNVLMVILVLVGLGGAEFAQTQMCSL